MDRAGELSSLKNRPAIPARAAKMKRMTLDVVLVISIVLSGPSFGSRDGTLMKCQDVNALLPLYRVDANDRRFAGKLDRRDNRVELGCIEVALKLFPRFPVFDQQ